MTLEEMSRHELVGEVRVVPRGHVALDTTMVYADGSGVQVFIEAGRPDYSFTDFGHAMYFLAECGFDYTSWLVEIDALLGAAGVVRDFDSLKFTSEDFGRGVEVMTGVLLAVTAEVIYLAGGAGGFPSVLLGRSRV